MNMQPTDASGIARDISVHGAAPNARLNLQLEVQAAVESQQSGLYISWMPHPSCILGPSAADEIKNGTGQCCRIGSHSVCRCGHMLGAHQQLGKLKSGYNKPPTCSSCKRCSGFDYSPHFPEECGQWWLSRRKDFNLVDWRKRVRENAEEYCCIGCEQKVSDHETIFENRATRKARGAAVDEAYQPLADQQHTNGSSLLHDATDMAVIREHAFAENAPVRTAPRIRAPVAKPKELASSIKDNVRIK